MPCGRVRPSPTRWPCTRACSRRYYIGILRSAELTGNLDVVLDQLAGYIERDLETTRAIRSALIYPIVILVMSIGTVLLLVTYVLPKFKTFFKSFDAKLPLPTRMLLAVGDFFDQYGLIVLGLSVVGFLVFLVISLQTESGKKARRVASLKLPMVKDVIRFAVVERFCRILSAMLKAGVPVPEAMTAALEATNNRIYQAALLKARDATLRGEGISRPIQPPNCSRPAAEDAARRRAVRHPRHAAGRHGRVLRGGAAYRLKRITTLFEPVSSSSWACIVGFVAIALVSAMYGIYNQVKIK